MSRIYDNWEKLVEATLKRDLLRQLALLSSRESSFNSTTTQSDDYPDNSDSELVKESPGLAIAGLQISGSSELGSKLRATLPGTARCRFQWVRYDRLGSKECIEGATSSEYVVTKNDIGEVLAVECIPVDEEGRQGGLLRVFANDHEKIEWKKAVKEKFQIDSESPHLPGIESFQIVGSAKLKPGRKLQSCGYTLHGTSSVRFQWVRHGNNGSKRYIEGATNAEYVVTKDDIGKYLSVECLPMDEEGRAGDVLRIFANDHRKIGFGEYNCIGTVFSLLKLHK